MALVVVPADTLVLASFPTNGGGTLSCVSFTFNITPAAASHSLDPILADFLGNTAATQAGGKVIFMKDGGGETVREAGPDGCTLCLNVAGQALTFRNGVDGVTGAANIDDPINGVEAQFWILS